MGRLLYAERGRRSTRAAESVIPSGGAVVADCAAMDADTAQARETAEGLRAGMVDRLRDQRWVRTRQVDAAMRAVPRHVFVPEVPLETAYADDSIVTKRDTEGTAVSLISAPSIVAMMLDQLEVEPGHRVLEIGAGTGYNAALLAHLVGETGQVTTVDLDADLVDGARWGLSAAGCGHVRVFRGDGEFGYQEHAPYDRVIVTVGAWDLPPAWLDQLAADGRLVVPLRLRGSLIRSIAFERVDGYLRSQSIEMCGFVPMRGAGAYERCTVPLTDEGDISLQTHDEQTVDTVALGNALNHPRTQVWTAVPIGAEESIEWMELWLACTMDGLCRIMVQPQAVERGLVKPAFGGSVAVFDQDSFAYLTLRPINCAEDANHKGTTRAGYEFGVCAHGPGSTELVGRVADQIRTWDRDHRSGTRPQIKAHPAGTDAPLTGQFVFDKQHTRLVVSWPETSK
ncbi:MAG: methyltransferase, FxLD system [Pseudonocardiales bacterium]|nr:methyltransferase, FxLD system [Pseudonocardiales bacterium]